jgi:hypothetical protein
MSQEIHIVPEFKALIPPLAPDEYAQLEENLLAEGCRDPLVLWHDVLIDGHNRYEICQKHGIAFQTVQREFVSLDDAYIWVAKNQLGRRNITDFVRAELALLIKPKLADQAKQHSLANLKNAQSVEVQNSAPRGTKTRDELAAIAGISHDTVRKVEKIKAEATPEVIEKARAGEISINAAAKTIGAGKRPKPAAVAAPENPQSTPPAFSADDEFGPSADEIAEAEKAEAEQLEYIKNLLANEADPLTKALADIKQLRALNAALKSQNDGYQNTINEQIKKIKSLERRIEKLQKQEQAA